MRRLFDMLLKVRESHHYVRVSAGAKEDLSWWVEGLFRFNGSCTFICDKPLPSYVFSTEACLEGGGAHFMCDWVYRSWEVDFPELVGAHINVLELFMVFLALLRWAPFLRGRHVMVRSDNVATIAALNKGTSRGPELMQFDLVISGSYLAGDCNVMADRISRLHDLHCAREARLLLSPSVGSFLMGNGHMSHEAFLFLQRRWMQSS
jgi:hypothetical protein